MILEALATLEVLAKLEVLATLGELVVMEYRVALEAIHLGTIGRIFLFLSAIDMAYINILVSNLHPHV